MGADRGERPPWIFKHGPNFVDRGLIVQFFGLCYFSIFFSVGPSQEEAK